MTLEELKNRKFSALAEGVYDAKIIDIRAYEGGNAIDYEINGNVKSQVYSNDQMLLQHLDAIAQQMGKEVSIDDMKGKTIKIKATYRAKEDNAFLNLIPTTTSAKTEVVKVVKKVKA